MTRLISQFDRWLSLLCWSYQQLCAVFLIFMLLVNMLNIVWRAASGGASLNWVWPWTMVVFMWWVMMSFFPLYRKRKDVSIYLVLSRLSPAASRLLGVLVYLAIFAGMMVLLSSAPARLASAAGTIEIVGLPRWVLVVPLLFSAVPIALDALLNMAKILFFKMAYEPFGKVETAK